MKLRSLLVPALLSTLVLAQESRPKPAPSAGGGPVAGETQDGTKGGGGGKSADGKGGGPGKEKMSEEELARMTPEQRLEHNLVAGANTYCTFTAAVEPRRIAPGSTGKMVITMVLLGDAVLPSPANLTVLTQGPIGPVTLGAAVLRPAGIGRSAKFYLGREVYDETAILEVPLSVAADAKVGQKQHVSVGMKFDLNSGSSGQVISRFVDHVSADVEFGQAPDPAVSGNANAPRALGAGDAREPVAADRPAARPAANPSARTGEGQVRPRGAADPAGEPVTSAAQDPPIEPGTGAMSPLVLVGGGAILLVLAVVLLARRR